MAEQMCIIARADMDETEIIDVIHPSDLPAYMEGAYKMLEDKLQTRVKEDGRNHVIVKPVERLHKEGVYFGSMLTIKFDDGDYPWEWTEFYHYTIKDIWKPENA